jgi:hypothetical protein
VEKIAKKGIIIFIVLGLIYGIGQYFVIKNSYLEPYQIVSELIEQASANARQNDYFLGDAEWESLSEGSVYKQVRESLSWEEFKQFVQQCDGVLTSDGLAVFKVMRKHYKDDHRSITVECLESTEPMKMRLLLERVEGSWKIVGKEKE